MHAATVGLNARFARIATRGDVRDRLGRFAYLLAAAYAMRRRPAFGCELRLEVTLDGDILGTLPGDFEVAGEALRVITSLDFNDIDD